MSRLTKALLLLFLIVFVLACNFVTQPINQAQDAVETVQSLATALPLETLQALPSVMPDIEMPTGMPDLPDVMEPKDPPLTEWNGIPIIPSATAGSEMTGLYSFKTTATTSEVFEYYKAEMARLGWEEFFTVPDTGSGAILTYQKGSSSASITITASGSGTLVFLTSQ